MDNGEQKQAYFMIFRFHKWYRVSVLAKYHDFKIGNWVKSYNRALLNTNNLLKFKN